MSKVELKLDLGIISWSNFCKEIINSCNIDPDKCLFNGLSSFYYKKPVVNISSFNSEKSLKRLGVELIVYLRSNPISEGSFIPTLKISSDGLLYIDLSELEIASLLDWEPDTDEIIPEMQLPITYVESSQIPDIDPVQLDYICNMITLVSDEHSLNLEVL